MRHANNSLDQSKGTRLNLPSQLPTVLSYILSAMVHASGTTPTHPTVRTVRSRLAHPPTHTPQLRMTPFIHRHQ